MTALGVVIFPEADTTQVEQFRADWDPLADAVAAHITIVFPLDWPGSASDMGAVLAEVASDHASFAIELNQPTIWDGEYLFLLADEGKDRIARLHGDAYAHLRIAAPARFVPHMTVGRSAQRERIVAALGEADRVGLSLSATVRSLSVYLIGAGDRGPALSVDLGNMREAGSPK